MNKHSAVQWVNEEIQQILRKKSFGPFETKEEVEKLMKNHAQKKNDGTVRLWVVIIKLKLACGKSRFYVIPTTDVPKWEDLIKKEDNISLFCIFFLKSLYLEESN
ncbi:MAG: hypothetical protein KC736_01235 [Candidatus Moranbacteria bacterium]|nr:hypothetical protein [Candidatus Moranbacteria bacterium]